MHVSGKKTNVPSFVMVCPMEKIRSLIFLEVTSNSRLIQLTGKKPRKFHDVNHSMHFIPCGLS